jgi:hypothetical protein
MSYSDAAKAQARKMTRERHPLGCICVSCDDIAQAYDVGRAAAYLEPVTPTVTEGHGAAAAAYAGSRWVADSNGYHEAAQAYDAALASVPLTTQKPQRPSEAAKTFARSHGHDHEKLMWRGCVLAARFDRDHPAPEPVRLTADQAAQLKPGAQVQGSYTSTVVDTYSPGSETITVRDIVAAIEWGTEVILLAPDPDADVAAAVTRILDSLTPRETLAALRRGGCDALWADS